MNGKDIGTYKRGWTTIKSEIDFDCTVGEGVLLVFMPQNDVFTIENVVEYVRQGNALRRVVLFGDALPTEKNSHAMQLKPSFLGLSGSPTVITR